MVGDLDEILEKVLLDFSRLFQRIGAVWMNEGLAILRDD